MFDAVEIVDFAVKIPNMQSKWGIFIKKNLENMHSSAYIAIPGANYLK